MASLTLAAPTVFDAPAYLARLHRPAPEDASLSTLNALLRAHMRAIPFENFEVLMGRTPRIDLVGVQAKLVEGRRGGYCFEHAALLGAALRYFGFAVRDLLARVVLEQPKERAGRTHHCLLVTLPSGPVIVDPGFGGMAPRIPVPLIDGRRVRIGREAHVMRREGEHWTLWAELGHPAVPRALWTCSLEETFAPDLTMGNHYTATHPDSKFRQRLNLRALLDDGRISVLDRDVSLHQGLITQRWQLRDRTALRQLLQRYFGFDLPELQTLPLPGWPAAR